MSVSKWLIQMLCQLACKSLGMGAEIYWGDSKYQKQETIETIEQAKEYVLNFGKYKGKKLSEIPEDYLTWLYNTDKTDETIKKAINLLNQNNAMENQKEKKRTVFRYANTRRDKNNG